MARVEFASTALTPEEEEAQLADTIAAIADERVQEMKNIGTGVGAVIGAVVGAPGGPSGMAKGATVGADWGGKAGGAAAGEKQSAGDLAWTALRTYGATHDPDEVDDEALDVVGATMGGV